jgi:hypothetical protein
VVDSCRLRKHDLSWRELGDEIVVLDLRASSYLSVRGSGSVLWPLLVRGATMDELVGELLRLYDVDEGTVRRDVEEFVNDLVHRGLVKHD